MFGINSWLRFFTMGLLSMGALAPLAAQEEKQKEWIKPRGLKPGDTIMFVAPAAPVEMPALLEYARSLEKAGYKVVIPKGINRKSGYLAGSDDERAAELNAAIRDPKVRAIFPLRGGYGLTRILDRLDYAALRRDPKIITGFSDLTALHLAIARQARVVTFHSPMSLRELWQPKKEFAFAATSFRRAVFADQYKDEVGYTIALPSDQPRPIKVVGGKARGRLLGGNLTLISSTLGTPYAIEPKGAILFMEDVNEAPYRVDRYLSQLRLAGVLDAVAGVVLGNFTNPPHPTLSPKDDGGEGRARGEAKEAKEIERVLREYFAGAKVPVVMNFPVGHVANNATLPHGALVELDGDAVSLRLLENPVQP
jgi:muramoyltetrapeptide carboxypeptidase